MPRWMWVGVLGVAGCFELAGPLDNERDSDQVSDVCPQLSLGATALTWVDVEAGVDVPRLLPITNDCLGTTFLVVDLSFIGSDTSFSLPRNHVEVAPGETASVEVVFNGRDLTEHTSSLKLTAQGLPPRTVGLTASAGFLADADGDGHDSEAYGGDDCDDSDPNTYLGARELCYDGIDEDCLGGDDYDCDGDGYRAASHGGTDCDDAKAFVYPTAAEAWDVADNDCDGLVDEDFIGAGDVWISEVAYRPSRAIHGEWIEVYNGSGHVVNLINWRLRNQAGQSATIVDSLRMPVGSFAVLGVNADTAANGGVDVDQVYAGLVLGDSADTVSLTMGGTTIASVKWTTSDAHTTGVTLQRDGRLGNWTPGESNTYCQATTAWSASDYGTPGDANDSCTVVASDLDGDGYAEADGDCDDGDAAVNPGETELWGNGIDDDCSGAADDFDIDSVKIGYVDADGSAVTDYLGFRGNLGFGDVDGDGDPEVVIGGWYSNDYLGGVYVLPGEDLSTWSGRVTTLDDANVVGTYEYNYLGAVGSRMADNDGDGVDDLFVGGHDYYNASHGNVAAALFSGGSAVTGALDASDADLTLTGSDSFVKARVHSGLDVDGDGVAELLYGDANPWHGTGATNYYGRVVLVVSDGLTGSVDLDDGDVELTGDAAFDYLGESIGGGDLDGDGYDDLVLGALGDDEAAASAGAYYVVFGSSGLPSSDSIEDAYDIKYLGGSTAAEMGQGPEPGVGDLDDDGDLDLALPAFEDEAVYVHFDVGADSGTVAATSADVTLTNTGTPDHFGVGLAVGDLDDDGVDDLAIGAPDDDTQYPGSYATTPGIVYVWFGPALNASSLDQTSASAAISGMDSADGFGMSLLAGDLDGDGDDDLAVGASGYDGNEGRIYFISW